MQTIDDIIKSVMEKYDYAAKDYKRGKLAAKQLLFSKIGEIYLRENKLKWEETSVEKIREIESKLKLELNNKG